MNFNVLLPFRLGSNSTLQGTDSFGAPYTLINTFYRVVNYKKSTVKNLNEQKFASALFNALSDVFAVLNMAHVLARSSGDSTWVAKAYNCTDQVDVSFPVSWCD